ncbi:DNA excision repair protein ERCC-6 [Phytophthora pseudosyringae]|uniref:DNA excision repair protein ERCC-6 n=1 Tax=Phytophthora pseudosyringae TaxID=221518 RepID=A0A8T1VBJ1_9STRA|nr:DNA excision repair protein ERCC-6 [Phytophthora pseudosyringae]
MPSPLLVVAFVLDQQSQGNTLKSLEFVICSFSVRRGTFRCMKGAFTILPSCWTGFGVRAVEAEVVELAAGKGRLKALKYWRRQERDQSPNGRGFQVKWGCRSVQEAATTGNYEVVRWLYEQELHSKEDVEVAKIICRDLSIGDKAFAEFLMPAKHNVFDYASYHVRHDWILEFGRDAACAVRAFATLAKLGELELMRSILTLHSPLVEE